MILRERLIRAAERKAAETRLSLSTISGRLFNDGKVIARLKQGGDITTRRFDAAMAALAPGGGLELSASPGDRRGEPNAKKF